MQRVLVLVLAAAACGGSKPPPPTPPQNTAPVAATPTPTPAPVAKTELEIAMAAFDGFRGRMCACPNKACADTVQEDMNAWAQGMAAKAAQDVKPTEAEMKRMTEIGTTYAECMMKVMGADTSASPPPPP